MEIELNRKAGQTALIRQVAWLDKGTDQQLIYMQKTPFTYFSLNFPTLTPPQSTLIPSFPSLLSFP